MTMETMLVRLKPYDPRRGNVLRRFTFRGIKFHEERGWYRVEGAVADYLRGVHQVPSDPYSPRAFDVCTEAEAKALEATQTEEAKVKRNATDDLKVVPARPPPPQPAAGDPPEPKPASPADDRNAPRQKPERK
jgi:hypothetical protein